MSAAADTTEHRAKPRGAGGKRKKIIGAALGVFGIALAAFLLYRTLGQYTWDELKQSVLAVPMANLLGAFGFAAASYLCLTGFDWLATRYAGKPMPWRRAAHASFVSLSLGHNIGFAALSSGAIRYRFYTRWGLSTEQVAKVILFCGVTVGIGLLLLSGAVLSVSPQSAAGMMGLNAGLVRALGIGCLALCAAWVACSAFIRAPVHIRRWTFAFPPLPLALGQLVIGPLNFACVAACLHQALSASAEVDYASVASAYMVAQAAALMSHVPGGLGVIETVVAWLIPGGKLIGALLVFRFVYFLAPLALGLLTFAATEAWWRARR